MNSALHSATPVAVADGFIVASIEREIWGETFHHSPDLQGFSWCRCDKCYHPGPNPLAAKRELIQPMTNKLWMQTAIFNLMVDGVTGSESEAYRSLLKFINDEPLTDYERNIVDAAIADVGAPPCC